MPTWTVPTTWVDGQLVGASALNTHLRDNLNALMNPNNFIMQAAAAFSTTATTLATLTSTALVVQGGGPVLIAGQMPFFVSNNHSGMVVMDIDGTQQIVYSGLAGGGSYAIVPLTTWWTGLTVATHTISIKWKVESTFTASTTATNIPGIPVTIFAAEL